VNLFIVGAMRCGTTSFSEMLNSHQDIYGPPIKEPHYFSDPLPKEFLDRSRFFTISGYFKNTFPKPLHSAQIFEPELYSKLYSLATHQKYLVDASTSYLHEPNSAKRIKEYNPSAKIIILTRDPLERAFSHYTMNLGLGRERKSFTAVMKRELELYKQGKLPWYSYLNMSCYQKPIQIYKNFFRDVLVISLEGLTENTAKELEKVAQFLAISRFPFFSFPHLNEGRSFKSQKIFYLLKKLGLKDWFSRYIDPKIKKQIIRRVSSKTKTPMYLLAKLRSELEEVSRHKNRKTLNPQNRTKKSPNLKGGTGASQ